MSLSFVRSIRGGKLLVYKDYLYHNRHKYMKSNLTHWRCIDRRCKATVCLKNDLFRSESGFHNHEPEKDKILAKQIDSALIQKLIELPNESIPTIYEITLNELIKKGSVRNESDLPRQISYKKMYRARASLQQNNNDLNESGLDRKENDLENDIKQEDITVDIDPSDYFSDRFSIEEMADDNLSAVLKQKDELVLENRKIPTPSPREVLIAIHSVGICGSDVHYWKKGGIGNFIVKEPMVLGHETSGTVIKVGEEVTHLKQGDRVCIEPGVPCGKCEFCKGGRYNICPDIKFCATPPVDGSLCRYYCHDADYCFKLPDNVTFEEGALIEPLSCSVHACRRAGVTTGKSVLICGAGPIGLLTLLTCKAMGVSKICITDISTSRLLIAESLGATSCINVERMKSDAVVEEVIKKMGGHPDITLECSGATQSITLGLRVTKPGGVLLIIGLGQPEIKIPMIEATVREVDIRGIFRYANCYPTALELVASGAIDVKPLITHHFTLEESLKAFETAQTGAGGAIKVMIHCRKSKNQ